MPFACHFSLGQFPIHFYTLQMVPPRVRLIIVPWLIPRWAQAQVWGNVILVRRGVPITEQLLAHELAHVLQWRLMGILPFVCTYLKYFLRHGYLDHPLEHQARAATYQDFYCRWARHILCKQPSLEIS
jgi:hypothetical protein